MPRPNKPTGPTPENTDLQPEDINHEDTEGVSAFDLPKADVDDVPDGFETPTEAPVYETVDDAGDLSGFTINEEATDVDRSLLSPPTGDYNKRGGDPWRVRTTFYEGDKAPGDLSTRGRMHISFTGAIENEQYTGNITFTISPDRRFHRDFITKEVDERRFDGRYKLYLQALDYYEEVTEEKAKSLQDLVNLLSYDENLMLRVYKFPQSGSGSGVTGFKHVND